MHMLLGYWLVNQCCTSAFGVQERLVRAIAVEPVESVCSMGSGAGAARTLDEPACSYSNDFIPIRTGANNQLLYRWDVQGDVCRLLELLQAACATQH